MNWFGQKLKSAKPQSKGCKRTLTRISRRIGKIEDERQAIISELDGQQTQQQTLKGEAKSVFDERLSLEREIAQNESTLSLIEQLLKEAQALETLSRKQEPV